MRHTLGIAITAICLIGGCASTRSSTFAQRDQSARSLRSEWDEPTSRSGSARPRLTTLSQHPNLEPQSDDTQHTVSKVTIAEADGPLIDAEQKDDHTPVSGRPGVTPRLSAEPTSTLNQRSRTGGIVLTSLDDVESKRATSITDDSIPDTDVDEQTLAAVAADTATAAAEESLPAGYELNLTGVLDIADAKNPNVIFARERINEAYARVDRAQVLWLPSIRTGVSYFHHEGDVQDVIGNVFRTNKSNFFGGFGAGSGAGSGPPAVPGLVAQFHITDAIFQPRITGHQAASRQFGATAARNDILRNTAVAYLELLRSEQSRAIYEEALRNTEKLVDLTDSYAKTGQGLKSDYERMLAEKAVREADVISRIESVRVSSARLAQLLHADASIRFSTNEPVVVPIKLIDVEQTPTSLLATALTHRPELGEQRELICEAVERLQREKYAPLVPSVLLGMSYGGFAGGLGDTLGNGTSRFDTEAVAFWEVRNLGLGERAARNEMSSMVRQAQQRELAMMDQVAREVVESLAQVVERERRIEVSKQGIIAAERSYELNVNRIRNAQGLPIEALQSVQALAIARTTYLNSVIDYNIAQFELCRAIGWFEDKS